MSLIEVGSDAPDFEVLTSTGSSFHLSDMRGNKRVMLAFYPKDFTSGCTDQVVEIRNTIDQIRGDDTEPVGVNQDGAESHQKFRETYELPFDILVDEDSNIATAYGSLKDDGSGGTKRSVILIGKNGKVIFSSEGAPAWPEVREAIAASGDGA